MVCWFVGSLVVDYGFSVKELTMLKSTNSYFEMGLWGPCKWPYNKWGTGVIRYNPGFRSYKPACNNFLSGCLANTVDGSEIKI